MNSVNSNWNIKEKLRLSNFSEAIIADLPKLKSYGIQHKKYRLQTIQARDEINKSGLNVNNRVSNIKNLPTHDTLNTVQNSSECSMYSLLYFSAKI